MTWDIYRKDRDWNISMGDLSSNNLEVRINLDLPVVEAFLDVDRDSPTWQLSRVSSQGPEIAVIVAALKVAQWWRLLQFGRLEAYYLRLVVTNQNVKIPSVRPQTPNAGNIRNCSIC